MSTPLFTLTPAHLLWLVYLAVVAFYVGQYIGSLLLPGVLGPWTDPTLPEQPWTTT